MNRLRSIVVICLGLALLVGCSTKGPRSVRFTREVDEKRLAEMPKQKGKIVLLIDTAFWTSEESNSGIPIAKRPSVFILGPGAAQIVDVILTKKFDEVVSVRRLALVKDLDSYDYVVRMVQGPFDDRTLLLPILVNQRYWVDLRAEVYTPGDVFIGRESGNGARSFWIWDLLAIDPFEGDERLLDKASVALNAAVQESLFELVDNIAKLIESGPTD